MWGLARHKPIRGCPVQALLGRGCRMAGDIPILLHLRDMGKNPNQPQ